MQHPGEGLPDPPRAARPGLKKPVRKKKKKPAPASAAPEPAPEPLERFPGMSGFGGLGGALDAMEDDPTNVPSPFGDDAWMNGSAPSIEFDSLESEGGRPAKGLVARIQDLGRWLGFFAGLGGLAVFLLSARGQIVDLWPAAARLYEVIGLPVEPPGAGLLFQNIKSEQRTDNGVAVLVLEGQIANASAVDRVVPAVIATTLGPDHKPVKSWHVVVTQARLEPGAIATFRSMERDPGAVAEVAITFAAE
ncbi:MAG: hypothetical protein WCO00_00700 [Rhodospirillaceae bacterium]